MLRAMHAALACSGSSMRLLKLRMSNVLICVMLICWHAWHTNENFSQTALPHLVSPTAHVLPMCTFPNTGLPCAFR